MYQLSINTTEHLFHTHVYFSLSETDDSGVTKALASSAVDVENASHQSRLGDLSGFLSASMQGIAEVLSQHSDRGSV